MQNLRVVIGIARHGAWLVVPDGAGLALPSGHVREGETLRYALARIARDVAHAGIRLTDIAAVGESEYEHSSKLCIEIYARATLTDNESRGEHLWATLQELHALGLPAAALEALDRAIGCPYLGIMRRSGEDPLL